MEKRKLLDERSQMEKEIERSSKSGDLSMNVNYSSATRREDPIMLSRINKLEETNMELKIKVTKLSNELEQARGNLSIVMKPQMQLSPFSRRKEDDN